MPDLQISCVHGLGDHRSGEWMGKWENVIRQGLDLQDPNQLECQWLEYDHLFFNDVRLWPHDYIEAAARLLWSGITAPRKGWFKDTLYNVKRTAGYVVAWVEDEGFQEATRELFYNHIREHEPDLLLAHSLGTLVTYNALTHEKIPEDVQEITSKMTYITLGSQLGNPFVTGNLTPGRIVVPKSVKEWLHLYNPQDKVFTKPIRINERNFEQLVVDVNCPGDENNHSAVCYLGHDIASERIWKPLGTILSKGRRKTVDGEFEPVPRSLRRNPFKSKTSNFIGKKSGERKPRKRAVLVGINRYAGGADSLYGCVNDVFLMSSVLQQCGFEAEDIRVVFDDRATRDGIIERMEWLFEDPHPGDQLFFYYSGHGVRIPIHQDDSIEAARGRQWGANRLQESLVPHNFEWDDSSTWITDNTILDYYANLHYDVQLVLMFDCCHSGGMHRNSGGRIRGVNPPDDIRHRALRWNAATQMWDPRNLQKINEDLFKRPRRNNLFFGESGAVQRIGRAASLRTKGDREYNAVLKKGLKGPYLPIILEACRDDQFAYEYQHGVESYGVFTFAMATQLRIKEDISFADLLARAKQGIGTLGYKQVPCILGPTKIIKASVPWRKPEES